MPSPLPSEASSNSMLLSNVVLPWCPCRHCASAAGMLPKAPRGDRSCRSSNRQAPGSGRTPCCCRDGARRKAVSSFGDAMPSLPMGWPSRRSGQLLETRPGESNRLSVTPLDLAALEANRLNEWQGGGKAAARRRPPDISCARLTGPAPRTAGCVRSEHLEGLPCFGRVPDHSHSHRGARHGSRRPHRPPRHPCGAACGGLAVSSTPTVRLACLDSIGRSSRLPAYRSSSAHCIMSGPLPPACSQCSAAAPAAAPAAVQPPAAILVVGSLNLDVIIQVDRLPTSGETITARSPAAATAVGGKGANQAVAAARLAAGTGRPVRFVGRFGNDAAALEAALAAEGVDVTGCGRADLPSGQGIVLLEPDGGATSVVLGGANTAWAQVRACCCLNCGSSAAAAAEALVNGLWACLACRQPLPMHAPCVFCLPCAAGGAGGAGAPHARHRRCAAAAGGAGARE